MLPGGPRGRHHGWVSYRRTPVRGTSLWLYVTSGTWRNRAAAAMWQSTHPGPQSRANAAAQRASPTPTDLIDRQGHDRQGPCFREPSSARAVASARSPRRNLEHRRRPHSWECRRSSRRRRSRTQSVNPSTASGRSSDASERQAPAESSKARSCVCRATSRLVASTRKAVRLPGPLNRVSRRHLKRAPVTLRETQCGCPLPTTIVVFNRTRGIPIICLSQGG